MNTHLFQLFKFEFLMLLFCQKKIKHNLCFGLLLYSAKEFKSHTIYSLRNDSKVGSIQL